MYVPKADNYFVPSALQHQGPAYESGHLTTPLSFCLTRAVHLIERLASANRRGKDPYNVSLVNRLITYLLCFKDFLIIFVKASSSPQISEIIVTHFGVNQEPICLKVVPFQRPPRTTLLKSFTSPISTVVCKNSSQLPNFSPINI